jgi:hypothetical protein
VNFLPKETLTDDKVVVVFDVELYDTTMLDTLSSVAGQLAVTKLPLREKLLQEVR